MHDTQSRTARRPLETRDRPYVPSVSVRRRVAQINVRMSNRAVRNVLFNTCFIKKTRKRIVLKKIAISKLVLHYNIFEIDCRFCYCSRYTTGWGRVGECRNVSVADKLNREGSRTCRATTRVWLGLELAISAGRERGGGNVAAPSAVLVYGTY